MLTLNIVHYNIYQDVLMNTWKKGLDGMKKIVLDKQSKKETRTLPRNQTFVVGDFVYLFAPSEASLQTRSRKLKIGPLQVMAVLDKSHYLLAD